MNIFIIGGSFAGVSCALTAKQLYPDADIHLVEAQSFVGFIPSGLNLCLNQEINSLNEAQFIDEKVIRSSGIKLYLDTTITQLNVADQTLTWLNACGETGVFSYDYLVLALGSTQIPDIIDDIQHPSVLSSKIFQAAETALKLLEEVQDVLIVGGGQIGLEAAEALVNANKNVTILEAESHLGWRYFDDDFIEEIQAAIEMVGVSVFCNEAVERIVTQDALQVITASQTFYPEAVLFGMNLSPQTALVKDVLTLNVDGTVKVDEYLRTNYTNILAVGDMVAVPTLLDESQTAYISLVNNAVRSGQIAAFNIINPIVKQAKSLRLIGSRIFSKYVISLGLTQREAQAADLPIHVIKHTSAYSITDHTPVDIKLIVHQVSGKILGAQLKSESDMLNLADVLAMALTNQLTDQDLAFQDRLYYPKVTATYPIIYQTALKSFIQRVHMKL